MKNPTVSIIMPAYNHAAYIGAAINSALGQTWQDFELIVVDDGSTDATRKIVNGIDSRVRYLCQENGGQGRARNTGIAHARGRYICFLDDDDLWEKDYLASVMSVFERHPGIDALYCGFQLMSNIGQQLPQRSTRVVAPELMYDSLIDGGWFPPLVVTVRKNCLETLGPLDESLRGHDDWDMWLRLASRHVFFGIPDILAHYRVHNGGLSADTEHMLRDHKMAVAKHFGPEIGDWNTWSETKRRAYSAAYRLAGITHLSSSQHERGNAYLRRAFELYPKLVLSLDVFYEVACSSQPRGMQGDPVTYDPESAGQVLFRLVDDLFADGVKSSVLSRLRNDAYVNGHLALSALAYRHGSFSRSQHHLFQSMHYRPSILANPRVMDRLLKSTARRYLEPLFD